MKILSLCFLLSLVQCTTQNKSKNTNLDSKKAKLHYDLAKSYYENGKLAQTINELKKAISLDNDESIFFHLLGLTQYRLGAADKAIKSLSRSINLEPRLTTARMDLSLIYKNNKDYSKAIKILYPAKDDLSFPRLDLVLSGLGELYLLQSQFNESIQFFDKSLRINVNACSSYYFKSIAELKNNDLQNAYQDSLKATVKCKNDPNYSYVLKHAHKMAKSLKRKKVMNWINYEYKELKAKTALQ